MPGLFALTMGGIIFAALGRNPLIGVILGWASSSGGFTANLFLAGTDALLAGITEGVVKEMGVAVDINPAMNYFFMASATFFPFCDAYPFYGKGCLPYGR